MNYFLFIIKSALEDFKRNKIRTFLTSLGILIGVSSVVLLIALGLGLRAYIQQQFNSLGSNIIYVIPGNIKNRSGFRGGPPTSSISFDDKDVTTLRRIRNVKAVAPLFSKSILVKGDIDEEYYELIASSVDIFEILNLEIEYGSPFTRSDADRGSKVTVLGPKVAEKLFGSSIKALGKTVHIGEQGFKVIGISKAKGGGGLGTPSMDEHLYAPFKSTLALNQSKKYLAIYVQAANEVTIPTVKGDAQKDLSKRYKKDDFSVAEQKEILDIINSIFGILNTILVAIAAISLIVGGVGIMNIMYVSVVERIREIGIRRAMGAEKKDILYQFLAEAILLSGLGGALGLFFSWIIVLLLQTQFPAYIDAQTVATALGVSSGVGIIFGVFPAKKAADLSPIEAIRYE